MTAIVAIGACLLARPIICFAEEHASEPPPAAASGAAPAASSRAGRWVHVDPRTGKRVARPAPAAAIAADPAFSTSHQGLVEQTAPGGGVMIDLQGRFRSAASATVGPDGKVAVDCVPPGTGAHQE